MQSLGGHRGRLDDHVTAIPPRIIEVPKPSGLAERTSLVAAGRRRPQPQLDARQPARLDPGDQAGERVLVVVIVAEREGTMDDHVAAVQLGDQLGQSLGVGVEAIAERVEVDRQLAPVERSRHAAAQQPERRDSSGPQRNDRWAGDRPVRIEVRSHATTTDQGPLGIPG